MAEEVPDNLSAFHTLQEWRWQQAEKIIHQHLNRQPVPVEVNETLLREEARRIPWNRSIRMFMVRKPS
jgi:hypothetical protein